MVNLVVRKRNAVGASSPQYVSAHVSTSPATKTRNYNFPHRNARKENHEDVAANTPPRKATPTQYRSPSPSFYRGHQLTVNTSPLNKNRATPPNAGNATATTTNTSTPQSFATSSFRNSPSTYQKYRMQQEQQQQQQQQLAQLDEPNSGSDAVTKKFGTANHTGDYGNLRNHHQHGVSAYGSMPTRVYDRTLQQRRQARYALNQQSRLHHQSQTQQHSKTGFASLPRHVPSPIRVSEDARPVSPLTQTESMFGGVANSRHASHRYSSGYPNMKDHHETPTTKFGTSNDADIHNMDGRIPSHNRTNNNNADDVDNVDNIHNDVIHQEQLGQNHQLDHRQDYDATLQQTQTHRKPPPPETSAVEDSAAYPSPAIATGARDFPIMVGSAGDAPQIRNERVAQQQQHVYGDPDGRHYERDARDPASYTNKQVGADAITREVDGDHTGRQPASIGDAQVHGHDASKREIGNAINDKRYESPQPRAQMQAPAQVPADTFGKRESKDESEERFGLSSGDTLRHMVVETKRPGITTPPANKDLLCDYDNNVTYLYELLEASQWNEARERCRSHPVEARTWIVRNDRVTKAVRWKILPLHAAVIFQAPVSVVASLLEVFSDGASLPDDQGMLPLHLAFRHCRSTHASASSANAVVVVGGPTSLSQQEGSASSMAVPTSSSLIEVLLQQYPLGVTIRDSRNRLPVEHGKDATSLFSIKVMQLYTQAIMTHHRQQQQQQPPEDTTKHAAAVDAEGLHHKHQQKVRELEDQVKFHKERAKTQMRKYEDDLKRQKKLHATEVQSLQLKHKTILCEKEDHHEQQLSSLRGQNDNTIEDLQQSWQQRLDRSSASAQQEIAELRDLLTAQQQSSEDRYVDMENKHRQCLDDLERSALRRDEIEEALKRSDSKQQATQEGLRQMLQQHKELHDFCLQQQEQLDGARAIREQLLGTLLKREQQGPEQESGHRILATSNGMQERLKALVVQLGDNDHDVGVGVVDVANSNNVVDGVTYANSSSMAVNASSNNNNNTIADDDQKNKAVVMTSSNDETTDRIAALKLGISGSTALANADEYRHDAGYANNNRHRRDHHRNHRHDADDNNNNNQSAIINKDGAIANGGGSGTPAAKHIATDDRDANVGESNAGAVDTPHDDDISEITDNSNF